MRITSIKNPTLLDTINAMRQQAHLCKKSLRPLAASICARLEPGDYNSEILAIYDWVRANIRYIRDIDNVEYVQSPARLIQSKQGDCDDIACLLASMLMAVGNRCQFVVVGFEPNNPSHVFCQVAVRAKHSADGNTSGQELWVTTDPVADENTAQMQGQVQYVQVYGI